MLTVSDIAGMLSKTSPITQQITGFSIDSRSIKPGNVFIAIKGDRFDGHNFIDMALSLGASCIIASDDKFNKKNVILVDNTRHALLMLADKFRNLFNVKAVAITGSCGKTTSKLLLSSILSSVAPVVASEKSFNNEIGVPLTIFRLNETHQYLIDEVGTASTGEIGPLAAIIKPCVSVLTNVMPAHLAGFDSMSSLVLEKASIMSGVCSGGTCILNADCEYFGDCLEYANNLDKELNILAIKVEQNGKYKRLDGARSLKNIPYSKYKNLQVTEITAKKVCVDESIRPSFVIHGESYGSLFVKLQLVGIHNVYNAMFAAACAFSFSIDKEVVRCGLEAVTHVSGRLREKKSKHGFAVIDDSYNANYGSVLAAISFLSQKGGFRVLVLGDMLDLGDKASAFHQKVGEIAKANGIERMICYGELSKHAAKSFGDRAVHFEIDQKELLIDFLLELPADVVLIKGSNKMNMSFFVKQLCD